MDKALIDSSTLFDIHRAIKKPSASWAQNSLGKLLAYRQHRQILTISGMTVFELLEGLYRGGQVKQAVGSVSTDLQSHAKTQRTQLGAPDGRSWSEYE